MAEPKLSNKYVNNHRKAIIFKVNNGIIFQILYS